MARSPQPQAFAALLRAHREAAGLTQETLAERAGVSPRAIQHLEAGDGHPTRPTLQLLAQALQLSPEVRAPFEAAAAPRPRRRAAGHGTAAGVGPPNLPAPRTALIGRDREVAALGDLVRRADARVVTLTGMGGVGKTRVALQLAADLRGAFPGGVWLVELASIADPALVLQEVAATLGVREAPGAALLDGLVARLRPKALLLVLDNCERVIEACAGLAERLLAACPALHILATSREPLQIAGERQWHVPPLAVPDPGPPPAVDDLARCPAVRLFVERAQAVAPAFRLTADNAAAVAQVCIRLDGIPLALELATARVRVLPVEQILARLDDSVGLLNGSSRARPSRQQTLRATLEWSHDLLAAPERAAFRRLAAFVGGFDLAAAEAVCSGQYAGGSDRPAEAGGLEPRRGGGDPPTRTAVVSHPYGRTCLLARCWTWSAGWWTSRWW